MVKRVGAQPMGWLTPRPVHVTVTGSVSLDSSNQDGLFLAACDDLDFAAEKNLTGMAGGSPLSGRGRIVYNPRRDRPGEVGWTWTVFWLVQKEMEAAGVSPELSLGPFPVSGIDEIILTSSPHHIPTTQLKLYFKPPDGPMKFKPEGLNVLFYVRGEWTGAAGEVNELYGFAEQLRRDKTCTAAINPIGETAKRALYAQRAT